MRLALKSLVIAAGVLGPLGVSANVAWRYRASAPKPPLHGIWDVASLERNGRPVPALYTDAARGRRVIVGRGGTLTIQLANDSLLRVRVKVDTVAGTLSVTAFRTLGSGQLAYTRADSGLTVTGTLDADAVRATLRRVDETKFLRVSRGFHWVNEVPFNR